MQSSIEQCRTLNNYESKTTMNNYMKIIFFLCFDHLLDLLLQKHEKKISLSYPSFNIKKTLIREAFQILKTLHVH